MVGKVEVPQSITNTDVTEQDHVYETSCSEIPTSKKSECFSCPLERTASKHFSREEQREENIIRKL